MITRDDILKGEKCPLELEIYLPSLVSALNKLEEKWGHPLVVTSGYRTPEHNSKIGGAFNSAHLYCMAADIEDVPGKYPKKLADWIQEDFQCLVDCGLWMEDPERTRGWVHLQIRPAHHRIFKP